MVAKGDKAEGLSGNKYAMLGLCLSSSLACLVHDSKAERTKDTTAYHLHQEPAGPIRKLNRGARTGRVIEKATAVCRGPLG